MAAPTRVQSVSRVRGTSVTSIALTFASAPAAGNTVVAAAILYNTNGSNFSCADNKGNTYTKVVAATNGGIHTVIFACNVPLVTGGTFTVTLTAVNGPGYFEGTAIEVTGAGGTGVLTVDQTMTQTATSATPSTGTTAALTGSDVFIVAGHAIQADQASITVQSVSPSWLQELENLTYSTSVGGEIDSRSVTGVAGSTQSCSWTDSTSAIHAAAVVVFKGSAASATAIARDGVVVIPAGGEGLTTYSFAKTISGPNPILFVACVGQIAVDLITGVTYAGTPMVLVDKQLNGNSSDRYHYVFMLKAPAIGTANVVISASSGSSIYPVAMSYTGALQTGSADATAKITNAAIITLTLPITVVTANSWVFAGIRTMNNAAAPGTGSSTIGADLQAVDSGGPVAAGAYSLSIFSSGTTALGLIAASFQPAAGGTPGRGGTGSMMGI